MSPGQNDTGRGTSSAGLGGNAEAKNPHPTQRKIETQAGISHRVRSRIARWIAPADQVFSRDLSLLLDTLTLFQDGAPKQLDVLGAAARMCRRTSELHDDLADSESDWLKAEAHRDFAKEVREVLFALQGEVTRVYFIRSKGRAS